MKAKQRKLRTTITELNKHLCKVPADVTYKALSTWVDYPTLNRLEQIKNRLNLKLILKNTDTGINVLAPDVSDAGREELINATQEFKDALLAQKITPNFIFVQALLLVLTQTFYYQALAPEDDIGKIRQVVYKILLEQIFPFWIWDDVNKYYVLPEEKVNAKITIHHTRKAIILNFINKYNDKLNQVLLDNSYPPDISGDREFLSRVFYEGLTNYKMYIGVLPQRPFKEFIDFNAVIELGKNYRAYAEIWHRVGIAKGLVK